MRKRRACPRRRSAPSSAPSSPTLSGVLHSLPSCFSCSSCPSQHFFAHLLLGLPAGFMSSQPLKTQQSALSLRQCSGQQSVRTLQIVHFLCPLTQPSHEKRQGHQVIFFYTGCQLPQCGASTFREILRGRACRHAFRSRMPESNSSKQHSNTMRLAVIRSGSLEQVVYSGLLRQLCTNGSVFTTRCTCDCREGVRFSDFHSA